MKFALINPNWSYTGSVYFGCREPHLPLELGYAQAVLHRQGHEAMIIDAHLFSLSSAEVRRRIEAFGPDFTVITTAPTYLFWRCPPPELRVPIRLLHDLHGSGGTLVAVGPHGSAAPASTLRKLGVDVVVRGECEDLLPRLAEENWRAIDAIAYTDGGTIRIQGGAHTADFYDLPPLCWERSWIERHRHHHHRFDAPPCGPGAEMEASRGCPYRCDFCAKELFRGIYRRRNPEVVAAELDRLLAQGVEYVYFVDEIFLPDPTLLQLLAERPVKFGIQTRIDLWDEGELTLLGQAGCHSVEAGVESLSEAGRRMLGKPCRLPTPEMTVRLIHARRHIPFVQANLVRTAVDDPQTVAAWREELGAAGVWANDPVPLFPYPGSPAYRKRWGEPDEQAWERSHAGYLLENHRLCDLQDSAPLPLEELETQGRVHG